MSKFTKKPVTIDAFLWTGGPDQVEDPVWIVDAIRDGVVFFKTEGDNTTFLKISTLEGVMTANPGDYIIKGVSGELYPCKPDIFEATYVNFNELDVLTSHVNAIVEHTHCASVAAGWWAGVDICDHLTVPAKLCLIHSEISEAMEGDRKLLMDDKLPHRTMIEVELADALIRIADLSGALGLDLGGAVDEKMEYNLHREDHKISNRLQADGKRY